jgi:hypothetical protein
LGESSQVGIGASHVDQRAELISDINILWQGNRSLVGHLPPAVGCFNFVAEIKDEGAVPGNDRTTGIDEGRNLLKDNFAKTNKHNDLFSPI